MYSSSGETTVDYMALGICYSVLMTVRYVGACAPTYRTVIHTE